MSDPLILVTGASGYLASYVVKTLQDEGYRVRGTVRSLKNADKIKHLTGMCPDAKHKLELVEADLTKADGWDEAVEGCTYVQHIASPFMMEVKHENDMIKPALEGTRNVLNAVAKAGTVKRVVLTSSAVAVAFRCGNTEPYNESNWTDLKDPKITAYAKSKHLAEKAAWDIVDSLADDKKFELAVVNPVLILGPALHGSAGVSTTIIKQLMMKEIPALPPFTLGVVDIRDVAQAHLRCMTLPEAAGNRHILCAKNMWFKDVADILRKEFASQGYNPPSMNIPRAVIWTLSWFSKAMSESWVSVTSPIKFDLSRMSDVLKINPIQPEKSIVDMAYSLVESGFVPKSDKYRGPPPKD